MRVVPVAVHVNGLSTQHDVEARQLLVQYIRETLGLTGPASPVDSLPQPFKSVDAPRASTNSLSGGLWKLRLCLFRR